MRRLGEEKGMCGIDSGASGRGVPPHGCVSLTQHSRGCSASTVHPVRLFCSPAGQCLVLPDFCIFLLQYVHPNDLGPAGLVTRFLFFFLRFLPFRKWQSLTWSHPIPARCCCVPFNTFFPNRLFLLMSFNPETPSCVSNSESALRVGTSTVNSFYSRGKKTLSCSVPPSQRCLHPQ